MKRAIPFLILILIVFLTANAFAFRGNVEVCHLSKATDVYKQRLDSIVTEHFDTVTHQWSYASKYEYIYNEKGHLIQETYFLKHKSQMSWTPSSKNDYGYDDLGKIIEKISYYWEDVDTSAFIPNTRTVYAYTYEHHTKGDVYQETSFYWGQEGGWIMFGALDYTYNFDGQVNYRTSSYIEVGISNSKWIPTRMEESIYNFYEIMTHEYQYYKSELTDGWKIKSMQESIYDDLRIYVVEKTHHEWNDVACQLIPKSKIEHIYDGDKFTFKRNVLQKLEYQFNQGDGSWKADRKTDYKYDYQYPSENLIIPFSQMMNHQLLSYQNYLWKEVSNGWQANSRTNYFYSTQAITGNGAAYEDEAIKVFPNPASEFITLKGSINSGSLEMYDVQGRKVMDINIEDGEKHPIGHLKQGLYLCKFNSGGHIYTTQVGIE